MTAEDRQAKKETTEGEREENTIEDNRMATASVFFMKSSIVYNEFTTIKNK